MRRHDARRSSTEMCCKPVWTPNTVMPGEPISRVRMHSVPVGAASSVVATPHGETIGRRSNSSSRSKGDHHGRTARGLPDHRDRRHRPGSVRGDDAGRHGGRGDPGRARAGGSQPGARSAPPRRTGAWPAEHRHRLEAARGRGDAARPRRARRRAHRGLSARRHGTARRRTGRVRRPQPQARLRPHDRVGPVRAVREQRGPRHQLHLARRRARSLRSPWRAAHAAAQHGR